MASKQLEAARQYVNANGGHAVVGPEVGVTPAYSVDVCMGRRAPSPQWAAAMGALIGVTPGMLMREDSDYALLTRKGAL